MTDLAPEVLPSVWSLIRRSLAAAPGITRLELVERLTPRGLIARQGQSANDSRHVRPSLNVLIELGIVSEDAKGALRLAAAVDSETDLRREVTQRIFEIKGDEDEIWRMRTELQPEHHAELGLAWLHLQGVGDPITSFSLAEARLQRQFGPNRAILRDGAPFNSLERLVRWCGAAADVAGEGGSGMIPDPTEAVRAALDEIIDAGAELPARAVVERIAAVFPWVPTGRIGSAVAARMTDVPDASLSRGTVPEGITLALIQLHHDGVVELMAGDDASDRVTLAPGGLVGSSGAELNAIGRVRRTARPE